MLFSVLTRKGQIPRHKLSPSEVRSQLRRGSSKLMAVITGGARHLGLSWPSASSGCPHGRGRTHRLPPRQTDDAVTSMGRGSLLPQGLGPAQWAALARAVELCRTHPLSLFPGPCSLPTGPRPGEPSPSEKARVHCYLILCLMTTIPPAIS